MPLFQDPNTAVLVLVLGFLGILFEFHAPGSIFPGVAGAACVLLAAATLSRYPLSPGAVTLIGIAVALLLVELKIHTYGLLSASGAILLASGLYLLIDSRDPALHIRPGVAIGVVLPFALLTAFLITVAARAAANKAATGVSRMVGQTGVVIAASEGELPLRIQIAGEYWNATAPGPLAPGTPVVITAVNGLLLSIRPLQDAMLQDTIETL